MSEPIKVGDLVMVVRGHECIVERLGGIPYTVQAIHPQRDGGWKCGHCGQRDLAPHELAGAQVHPTRIHGIPLSWLKRIPPLDELEGETRKEELTA